MQKFGIPPLARQPQRRGAIGVAGQRVETIAQQGPSDRQVLMSPPLLPASHHHMQRRPATLCHPHISASSQQCLHGPLPAKPRGYVQCCCATRRAAANVGAGRKRCNDVRLAVLCSKVQRAPALLVSAVGVGSCRRQDRSQSLALFFATPVFMLSSRYTGGKERAIPSAFSREVSIESGMVSPFLQ